ERDVGELLRVGENLRGQEGVSAHREEVVVNPDPLDLEDLCPESSQRLLQGRPWRGKGGRRGRLTRESQPRRQPDTLHFARRAFWNVRDDEHLPRHLEAGDAPSGELANAFRP